MKTIIKCTSALLLLFIFSCEEEGPPKTPEKNIIIICDLSSSLNLDYVELEVGKVQSIIDSLPYNTNFSIYPMNLSIYQNSLLKGFIKPETIFKTKNRAIQQEKKDLSEKVDSILISNYKIKNANKETEFKSCIISSFEMAFKYLPDNDDELLKNSRVILLTDMIEQCPESSAGSIYMCSKTRQPNFEKIKKQVQEEYNPRTKLSDKVRANQLYIVMTTNFGNQQKCLTENQQNEIWDIVLQKQGFVDNYAEIIRKKTEVPTKKELWNQ